MPLVYVRYQNNPTVSFYTQNIPSALVGIDPTVGCLIKAYFPTTIPNDLAQFTLHSSDDGPPILLNTVLSSIEEFGTFENPFVIKSSQGNE